MPPKTPVAYTWVKDYVDMAIDMQMSFHTFHKNIPLHIFSWKECLDVMQAYRVPASQLFAPLGQVLARQGFDCVMHIDADSLVTGSLERAFNTDADVAGVRANPDQGVAPNFAKYTRINRLTGEYNRTDREMNCGFFVVREPAFWEAWIESNRKYAGQVYSGEQDTWNDLALSGQYSCELLDPREGDEYWGTASQWGPYLDSWKLLWLEGTSPALKGTPPVPGVAPQDTWRLMLNSALGRPKQVRVLHLAGEQWQDKHLGFQHPRVRGVIPLRVQDYLEGLTKS
jgi:hypothetical protein